VLAVAAYLPSLQSGFIWDDDLHLLNNPVLLPHGLYNAWFSTQQTDFWPITWSGFWLQFQLFGPQPAGYHAINIFLHALNVALLYRVLLQLECPGAMLAGALFAVHPVAVEAVAWITQFKTLISMAFFLTSISLFLQSRTARGTMRAFYAASLLSFALGLLAKPSIVMLPFVLIILVWWRGGRDWRKIFLQILPYFALAAVAGLVEIWFQNQRSMAGVAIRQDSIMARIAGAGWVFWFYLIKDFVPYHLMFVYPRWSINALSPVAYLPLFLLVALFTVCFWKRRTYGIPLFVAAAYFLVNLLPVLGFLNIFYMRYSFVADHWQYTALPAPIALFAGGVTVTALHRPRWRRQIFAAAAMIVGVFFIITILHQRSYSNVELLYRDTLKLNPNASLARSNLASLLYRKGELDSAIREYEKALATDPNDPEAHAGFGNALFDRGRFDDAIAQYKAALPLMPAADLYKVHFELAETYLRLNQREQAIREYREVLRLRPNLDQARERIRELERSAP
jgi:tetratricopeptide (TPR) repeat protein